MNFVQVVPFRDLQRAIVEERDTITASVKENRARLPLYAEHRWAVASWRARKAGRPFPDIVA